MLACLEFDLSKSSNEHIKFAFAYKPNLTDIKSQ